MEITIEHGAMIYEPRENEVEINGSSINIKDEFFERTGYDGYGFKVHFVYAPAERKPNRAERRKKCK